MDAGWDTGHGEVREHFQIRFHPTWLAFYFAHLAVEMFKGIAYHKKYITVIYSSSCCSNAILFYFLCGKTGRLCFHALLHSFTMR